MAYQDQRPVGNHLTSLPSKAGNASHTLVAGHMAEMTQLLTDCRPPCTSTALSLLRSQFPERSIEEHILALRIYQERLTNP